MGGKITIDSATLMNKGLELIEAHHLFGTPYEQIDIVVHPQSIIHSLIQLCDGATLAHLGLSRTCACRSPMRCTIPSGSMSRCARSTWWQLGSLTFEPATRRRSPACGSPGRPRGRAAPPRAR